MAGAETRKRLLKAALDLLWRDTFGSAGVEEICRRARVHKGSFYHFFPSKEDLAVEALEGFWAEVGRFYEDAFSGADPIDCFRRFAAGSIELQKRLRAEYGFVPGCPFAAIGSELGPRGHRVGSACQGVLERIRDYFLRTIRRAIRSGALPAQRDPSELADDLLSCYVGVQTRARMADSIEPFERFLPMILRLLGGEAPRKRASGRRRRAVGTGGGRGPRA